MRTRQKKLFLFSMILWLVEFLITRISDSFPGATPLFVVICLIQEFFLLISVLLFSIIRNNQSRKAIRADSANF